jgi:hypothetical protein
MQSPTQPTRRPTRVHPTPCRGGRSCSALAQLDITAAGATVSLIVLVVLGSLTIAGPVAYHRVAGARAHRALDELKAWLAEHNAALTAVLFLVFGVVLIARGMAPLSD